MKLSITIMSVVLVGCASAPKEVKTPGDGVAYTETKHEMEEPDHRPLSFATKHRNGAKNDKDRLRNKRKKDNKKQKTWVFELGE